MKNMKIATETAGLPDAAAFRQWLFDALVALNLSASSVSVALGLGKNTLSRFLSAPGREVTLGNASRVTAAILAHARAEGVDLPAPPASVSVPAALGVVENA